MYDRLGPDDLCGKGVAVGGPFDDVRGKGGVAEEAGGEVDEQPLHIDLAEGKGAEVRWGPHTVPLGDAGKAKHASKQ